MHRVGTNRRPTAERKRPPVINNSQMCPDIVRASKQKKNCLTSKSLLVGGEFTGRVSFNWAAPTNGRTVKWEPLKKQIKDFLNKPAY